MGKRHFSPIYRYELMSKVCKINGSPLRGHLQIFYRSLWPQKMPDSVRCQWNCVRLKCFWTHFSRTRQAMHSGLAVYVFNWQGSRVSSNWANEAIYLACLFCLKNFVGFNRVCLKLFFETLPKKESHRRSGFNFLITFLLDKILLFILRDLTFDYLNSSNNAHLEIRHKSEFIKVSLFLWM